jgi:y4mF family transcriptional regulator
MWARNTAEIGKIIRAARLRRKLSQTELAQLLGTTQAWISEVEKGKDTAQIGLVLRVLTQLNVRLRADEPLQDMKPAKRPKEKHVDLDRIIEHLSRPARSSRTGK